MKKHEILKQIQCLIQECLQAYPESASVIFNIVNAENAKTIDALQEKYTSLSDLFVSFAASEKLPDKSNMFCQLINHRLKNFLEARKYHTHGSPIEVRLYEAIKKQTEKDEQ